MSSRWILLTLTLTLGIPSGMAGMPSATDAWNHGGEPRADESALDVPGTGPSDEGTSVGVFRPVMRQYFDAYMECDLNSDGFLDFVVQNYDTDTRWSRLFAYSGSDGKLLWSRYNWYATVAAADLYEREGAPHPRAPIKPTNFRPVGGDLNDDGVCDFIQYIILATGSLTSTPPLEASAATFELQAVSGLDGQTLWVKEYPITYVRSEWMRTCCYWIDEGLNIPTDLSVYNSPDGARIVLKTSDIFFHRARRPVPETDPPPEPWNYHIWTNEHIRVLDAKNGAELWARDILFSEDPERTIYTWITGLTDVTGDGRPEVILDQFFRSTPSYEDLKVPPGSEENLIDPGRGMRVIVLNGADGKDLWRVTLRDEEYYRRSPRVEETFESLRWTYAQVVPDVNGDEKPEVLALFLTQKKNAGATINGAYNTHIIPLDGRTGQLLWKNDVRIQGWGYVTTLHTPGHFVPALAVGTVDPATDPAPGAHFPPKDVRISLLDASDGSPRWTYEERFSQANYISSELALQQYLGQFAPYDWTGDGVLDIITPSAYVPAGETQRLLANAQSRFRILDGNTGKLVREYSIRGSNAAAAPCVSPEGAITTVSGHAQSLELSSLNPMNGSELWRHPIWYEVSMQAGSAGYDIVFLDVRCVQNSTGTIFYMSNLGLRSEARGMEIIPLYGVLRQDLPPLWQVPNVATAPNEPSLNPFAIRDGWKTTDIVLLVMAPLSFGGLAGIGLALFISRRRRAARWLKGLPALALVFLVVVLLAGPAAAGLTLDVSREDSAVTEGTNDLPADWFGGPPSRATNPSPPIHDARESDKGSSGDTKGTAPNSGSGRPALLPGAYGQLLRTIAHQAAEGSLTPSSHLAAVREYFGDLGYFVPRESAAPFEDNHTLAYARPAGDVDGDGVDDVLMEEWCLTSDGCPWTMTFLNTNLREAPQYFLNYLDGGVCGRPHRLAIRSGISGVEGWNMTLNARHPIRDIGCTETFVMGQLPTPDGHPGVLLYSLSVTRPALLEWHEAITHTFELIDIASGQAAWTFTADGVFSWHWALKEGITHADTFLLLPILQASNPSKHYPPRAEAAPTLMLQSVGYEFAYMDSFLGVPPQLEHLRPYATLIHTYQPREWVARVDLSKTGPNNEIWRVDTFTSEYDRSVLPYVLPNGRPAWYSAPFPYDRVPNNPLSFYETPGWAQDQYWNGEECCYDLTGDGVNDLLYKTIEWNSLPHANVRGPYFYDGTLVAFDGASGRRIYDVTVSKDEDLGSPQGSLLPNLFRYEITSQLAGDLDGDAIADYLVHVSYYASDYRRELLALKGSDGSELWRLEAHRDLEALVVGDADGDGGNDVAVVEFIDWEQYWSANQVPPQFNYWWLNNVTKQALTLYSGATGATVWRTHTWQAPADLILVWKNYRRNGLPDLDGDGTAEFLLDDPVLLPDLTTVHRQTVVSGRDLQPLWTLRAVGAFSVPIAVGDANGDRREELAIMSGDRTDLWLTLHDGTSGSALWSRRLFETRLSSAGVTIPNLDWLRLHVNGSEIPRYLVNLHLVTVTYRGLDSTVRSAAGQLIDVDPLTGNSSWGVPLLAGPNNAVIQGRPTPASELYLAQYDGYPVMVAGKYPSTGLRITVASVLFSSSGLVALAAGLRRWKA